MGFSEIGSAVEIAPVDNFELFSPLLESSLHTAVLNYGLNDQPPFNSAIGAELSVLRKWSRERESIRVAFSVARATSCGFGFGEELH